MKAIVRDDYVVFYRNRKYGAGSEIPAPELKEVLENQGWKVEVSNGKEERKEEETETGNNSGEEKEMIKDIAIDRMVKTEHTKKRGRVSKCL